ncbi:MAG: hypothetical protein WBF32_10790 [Candidatus Aminicenantaceae bacterium]
MNNFTVVLFILIVCGSVFLYQCGSDSPNEPSTPEPDTIISDPSFSQHIQPIFTNNCALSLCHVTGNITELDLSQSVAYSSIVNVDSRQDRSYKIVLPGNSTDSWLVIKIEGRQTLGLRMPPSADPLSDVRIQNIKNWVDRGAKDN